MCNRTCRGHVHEPARTPVNSFICAVSRKAQMHANTLHLRQNRIAILTKVAILLFFLL